MLKEKWTGEDVRAIKQFILIYCVVVIYANECPYGPFPQIQRIKQIGDTVLTS